MPSINESKTLKHSHGGYAGRSIIERIQQQMDKRRKVLEDMVLQRGTEEYNLNRGRYEGLAAALAILRSSSVGEEVERSNERLGIS